MRPHAKGILATLNGIDNLEGSLCSYSTLATAVAAFLSNQGKNTDLISSVCFFESLNAAGYINPLPREILEKSPFIIAKASQYNTNRVVCHSSILNAKSIEEICLRNGVEFICFEQLSEVFNFIEGIIEVESLALND